MRLNHLNLCVGDLSEAKDLFQSLFDFEVEQQKGDAMLVMNDRCGFTLVLSNPKAFGGEAPAYPEGFHLGFIVDTPEEVDRFCDRLAASRWHDGACRSRAISGAGIRCILRPWEESCSR